MKLPKLVIAVVALHVCVIGILLVQPGCQSMDSAHRPDAAKTKAPALQHESYLAQAANANTINTQRSDGFADAQVSMDAQDSGRLPPTRPQVKEPVMPLAGPAANTGGPVSALAPPEAEIKKEVVEETVVESAVYVVQSRDSLWKIANRFGVSVRAIQDANGLSKNAVIYPGDKLKIPGSSGVGQRTVAKAKPAKVEPEPLPGNYGKLEVYYIIPGDSLSLIARKFGTTVSELRRVNGFNSDRIYAGQEIRLPKAVKRSSTVRKKVPSKSGTDLIHKVKRGETLGGISRRYGVSVPTLMKLNGISSARLIRVGQQVVIKRGKQKPVQSDPGAVRIDKSSKSGNGAFDDLFSDPDSIPVVPVESQ